MIEPYTTILTAKYIDFEQVDSNTWKFGKNTRLSAVNTAYFKNVYVDLDGTLKPKKFDRDGLWVYEGQFFVYKGKGHKDV